MTNITAYNTLGTSAASRIVISYSTEQEDTREALNEAAYRAMVWNKTETRKDMVIHFVSANGMVRAI